MASSLAVVLKAEKLSEVAGCFAALCKWLSRQYTRTGSSMKTELAWPRARLSCDVESTATFVLPMSESRLHRHCPTVRTVDLHNCFVPRPPLLAGWCHDKTSNLFGSQLGARASVSLPLLQRASRPLLSATRGELFFRVFVPAACAGL